MRDDIILIGPIYAGKSTVAALLGEALGLPVVALDDLRMDYYLEIGFDEREEQRLEAAGGFLARYRYWKPFEIHAVERVLADHAGSTCVFEFGAGHAVYDDEAMFQRAQRVLAPYRNVVLLLPSPDIEESVRILASRLDGGDEPGDERAALRRAAVYAVNRHLIEHPSLRRLATMTVHTKGRTPLETRDEVLAAVWPRADGAPRLPGSSLPTPP